MISKKAITAWIFSAIVGIGMLAMPARAMAHDHDGDGWRHEHHDNGWHNGWSKHRGEDEDEGRGYYGRRYYQPSYGYGYGGGEPDADDAYGLRGYGARGYGWNGAGMINRRHPGLVWACDSQGHHCHWARRFGYGYGNQYYGNNGYGYGNGYYGNNGYPYGGGYYGNNGYGNGYYGNGYYGNNGLGGLGSLLGLVP